MYFYPKIHAVDVGLQPCRDLTKIAKKDFILFINKLAEHLLDDINDELNVYSSYGLITNDTNKLEHS